MTDRICQNCGSPYGPDDLFCENCGYDFVTGSLPASDDGGLDAPSPSVTAPEVAPSVLSDEGDPSTEEGEAATPGEVPRITVVVAVDRAFFDEVVNEGEIDFPDPVPADKTLELAGAELHIGRTSDSRAIHPDIDVADLTNDQAVSSRHAVLRVGADGALSIVDVGSTNGTFLATVDSEAIAHGVPVDVAPGTPIFVGAWTRLTVSD
ncbi:MAG: FHA domain-containing protein [Actinomycetota bacterium]